MELAPCNDQARQTLVNILSSFNNDGTIDGKKVVYVAKTFPDILLDVARDLIEQATNSARGSCDQAYAIRQQLKPYFVFSFLLGKAPQISNLMYSYFENSSFQPLPEDLFKCETDSRGEKRVLYHAGIDDELMKDILLAYLKYLSFNPRWFGAVWNWCELGRIVGSHTNYEIRYLAGCCLSLITKPNRHQHMLFMRDIIGDSEALIELQIKFRQIYDNSFTPVIETTAERVNEFIRNSGGPSKDGYAFCSESLANVTNVLLLKRDMINGSNPMIQDTISHFVPVRSLNNTISKIAYSASINKPCLIRGPTSSGKTSIMNYIAAHTNRINPPEYIKVQIGDQIDSKLIVGSYICTEIPGQFEWQPGPLTQAMAYGAWILFEDIDSAPSEMAQVIHSVIENGNLSCVSCCPIKLDNPHPDFRIFFTQRTRKSDSGSLKLGFGFVERLCDIVDVPELDDIDLKEILSKKYDFGSLIDIILQIYRSAEGTADVYGRSTKSITLRELFKFCDRLSKKGIAARDGKYASSDLEAILYDAIDCFYAHLPNDEILEPTEKLGHILNRPSSDVKNILSTRKPELREDSEGLSIGRVRLESMKSKSDVSFKRRIELAPTTQSLQLIEKVSVCLSNMEPVLLVGETGVGKTTIVQHLANILNVDLIVINLSQQSDSSDLLGGYRPVEMRDVVQPLHDRFLELFKKTYDSKSNQEFLQNSENLFVGAKRCSEWLKYLKVLCALCGNSLQKRQSKLSYEQWSDLMSKARRLSKRISEKDTSPMALAFSEGSLLQAVKRGKWILLDEINLAEPDVLQCLLLILDSMKQGTVHLNAIESDQPIEIHPNFRIFACMNPSTDVGKKELSIGVRGRFTEFYVDDITSKHDLRLIVESYVKICLKTPQIESIVDFYQEVRARASVLNDISGNSPVYSLRTLCRALTVASQNVCHNMDKSLYESLKITFLQQLNESSALNVLKLIDRIIFKDSSLKQIEETAIVMPQDSHSYVQVEGFWIQTSSQKKYVDENYIITKSVKRNLERLARIISLGNRKLPILIQGNTSVGKTSLIKYLARLSGNMCFRINNHEHTDLQEYIGRFVLKENGELQFQEGLLVTAMKKGYWVILDELNLAPCELLEALNRLLDDNRELFLPETREVIKAHSKFILFATQNPPEEYAGRKVLSRAFRNRFIELHFDEIPHGELEEILQQRCKMAPQYAKKIVQVMKELQIYRRESGCFNGKSGFMTIRDLFRWGQRYLKFKDTVSSDIFLDWDNFIASEGLILLEGRVRTLNEADTVKEIIEKVFKRKLNRKEVYTQETPKELESIPQFKHIHFTPDFQRLFVQLKQALLYQEPVLLCGQTGCGKTTVCQLYAQLTQLNLITYNCHLNTESSDFVGDVRPSRQTASENEQQMFPWVDGPLVQAMRAGSVFLMDEISLADDAVLERINSVLEQDRTITLSEKDGEEVQAASTFRFIATMNPGGDYGKKELSPALRNRFTEIYCHNTTDIKQIITIIQKSLSPSLLKPKITPKLIHIMERFMHQYYKGQDVISLRDVLNWTKFLNKTTSISQDKPLSLQEAIIEGASLVFFDQFGTCGHNAVQHPDAGPHLKSKLESFIHKLTNQLGSLPVFCVELSHPSDDTNRLKIDKFTLSKGNVQVNNVDEFIYCAPVVQNNLKKLMRALQLDKPILLEGDPGAGKTSIVAALSKMAGFKLVRINLSEQTDISDLFGSDLPDTENSTDGVPRFCWHDGPMLKAIKDSNWILLDEMNLASQSVLEGLNACFDHRGEIFIPELNMKFNVDRSATRIFACQNPYNQGAARKGLPKSFINRFTSIYIETHSPDDLLIILKGLYPMLSEADITKMIEFNSEINERYRDQGHEFNLRDMIYWCELQTKFVNHGSNSDKPNFFGPDRFVQFVYIDRMRSIGDKIDISEAFEKIFAQPVYEPPFRDVRLGEHCLILARSVLSRRTRCPPHLPELCILKYQMPYLESIAKALEFNKMPILVGQPGVGKRSMIRILAGLTGNSLNVIGANRDMDTIELLGSFEQKSLQRELVDLVEEARAFITSLISADPQKLSANTRTQLFKHIWCSLYATSFRDLRLSRSELMDAYRFQLNKMEELIIKMKPYNNEETRFKFEYFNYKISNLKNRVLFNSESLYSSGNFEWIDSILIKSMREGNWLLIENANLMNPATLDRLNSLVEPNGTLCLTEKGSGPQGIENINPHPDFRLILTMDPENGELSRAMRNRGIEIYVRTRFYFEDFLMLLNQNGFEPEEEKACMTYCIMQTSYDTHLKITYEEPEKDGSLLAHFGLNYLVTLVHQVRRGQLIDKILSDLFVSFYRHKGYLPENSEDEIRAFVTAKMNDYREQFVVKLNDDRYNWCNMRYDLVSLTGGDAHVAMLTRDYKIFLTTLNPVASGILNENEALDDIEVVIACTTVKVFLELATHGDLEHRKGFIRYTFPGVVRILDTVNNQLEDFFNECVPLINNLIPRSKSLPIDEMYIDTRNSPDLHYYLQSLDYQDISDREGLQNRWILSLHRITIKLITDLIEERSHAHFKNMGTQATSLWYMSEQVRANKMLKQDLVRPNAEIASDLHDLLTGILRVASNRCFENRLVSKMLARLFWIGFFICKLRRAYRKIDLIAVCNQIPMLWALTYQKVIVPIIKDCDLADLSYNNHKFSHRIQHICDFLDVTIAKPSGVEKSYHKKIVNLFAITTKRYETISREVDRFFALLLGRYTLRSQCLSLGSEGIDTLAASGLVWSNSTYMLPLYRIIDWLYNLEESYENPMELYEKASKLLSDKQADYARHENYLQTHVQYRAKCLAINKRRNALDQFAPVWQVAFIQARFSQISVGIMENPRRKQLSLNQMLYNVNGIIMSPRYYSTLMKLFNALDKEQKETQPESFIDLNDSIATSDDRVARRHVDMYSTFLVDHIFENIVLDNQVVGWTKLRVTTSDLSSSAPLIPEYSPIISLVSGYCLDITHLKLNSYQQSSAQLESMLIYLWSAYAKIKFHSRNNQDLAMAQRLIHLRSEMGMRRELVGSHRCKGDLDSCSCIEEYNRRRAPKFHVIIDTIQNKIEKEDVQTIEKAIKLIYFGYYHALEYAPIFTLDPSLRSREKLEVYKAELVHIKLDLYQRNNLYYWKTGENLRLLDIPPGETKFYPFSLRVLVERRAKLEQSIAKLIKEHTNRPKTDDGTVYHEMRKEVEVTIGRYTKLINALINHLIAYTHCKKPQNRAARLSTMISMCRMFIKSLERSITHFRSDYVLYADLNTNYLLGWCFVLQGMRRLYSRLEQKMQLYNSGFSQSLVDKFSQSIMKLFSFSQFTLGNIEAVNNKRALYSLLNRICPHDKVGYIQSLLLRSILVQLKHHIVITPSDIKKCIPVVRNIADKFHSAWLERKRYLEEQRKKQEELYQYRTSRSTLGNEISLERREFIDICTKFPTYDHVYAEDIPAMPSNADEQNLQTEAKIINLHRSVDLSMCIDICRAHYKFMKEASLNLLGQQQQQDVQASQQELKAINFDQLIELESEMVYTVIRECIPRLDNYFDSSSVECHLLQANELHKTLSLSQPESLQLGSLKGSIDILDENIFDIYHNANAYEALRFQNLISSVELRVHSLRGLPDKNFDSHPLLIAISKLISRISSFLITDPLMKFVSGAHILLQKIEDWNQSTKENRISDELDDLVELIKSWREIEVKSWRSSLHKVKRKYIDDTLCDLWFRLYEAFNDPIKTTSKILIEKGMVGEDFEWSSVEDEEALYQGFIWLIKEFFEDATQGDYQIRLDLVYSFAIQTRFATLYEQTRSKPCSVAKLEPNMIQVNYEKLTTYVYNIYRQYQGLMEPFKGLLEQEESKLSKQLSDEIRIVAWQGRSSLWDIKNNFRISHRKINKVMNRYLEVLRRPFPSIQPKASVSERRSSNVLSANEFASTRLASVLGRIEKIVANVPIPPQPAAAGSESTLKLLACGPRVVQAMVKFSLETNEAARLRYINVLTAFEDAYMANAGSIETFHGHKVSGMVINSRDTKEQKADKFKMCRQMYHGKKFAMQAIFKTLQQLGVSYQRGLNSQGYLDRSILSLEPLRGMIQHQSRLVLKAAANLIDDSLVMSCNELYRELMTKNQLLLAQPRSEDLTGDQFDRVQGYSLDMALDIIVHNKNAAMIYRHLMDIQAAAARLLQLQQCRSAGGQVIIYNFKQVHGSIGQFNGFVGRAFALLSKLDKIMDCHKTLVSLDQISDLQTPSPRQTVDEPLGQGRLRREQEYRLERAALREIIEEIGQENCLMTREQHAHIEANIGAVKRDIAAISCELRDKLNHTIRNYLYSDDDLQQIHQLYARFSSTFAKLLRPQDNEAINCKENTVLGSISSLLNEADQTLKPALEANKLLEGSALEPVLELNEHPNVDKLSIRLQKLLKQSKLAVQNIYKEEKGFDESKLSSESARRKLKPFNHIDSSRFRDLLRPAQVAKQTANCFMTLNLEQRPTNIEQLIDLLTPTLSIYTQNVACLLNVVLNSLQIKLMSANQLVFFFTHLLVAGFELPCKINELEGDASEQPASGKPATEDNCGFGEGGEGKEDASKKLEFESQLDELKKGDNVGDTHGETNDEKNRDDEKNVEAHDDGVEMTDDFEAKAQGPEEADERNELPDEDPGDADDEQRRNELEKQFDTVDQDEAHLDQNLWGDDDDEKDGQAEVDGEEDLREADLDPNIRPEVDERELLAKNKDLAQVSSEIGEKKEPAEAKPGQEDAADDVDDKGDETKQRDSEAKPPPPNQDETGCDHDQPGESEMDQDDGDEQEDGLDLDHEALLALKDNPYIGNPPDELMHDQVNEEEEENDDDDEDDKLGSSGDGDEVAKNSDTVDLEADLSKDADEGSLREEISMEVSDLSEDQMDANVHTINQEQAVSDGQPDQPRDGRAAGGGVGGESTDNEPQEQAEDENRDQAQAGDRSRPRDERQSGEATETEPSDGQKGDQVLRPDVASENEDAAAERSTKRTLAERSLLSEDETIKRQKIAPAAADRQDPGKKDDGTNWDETKQEVRHVEVDTSEAIEVIDIALDYDDPDDYLLDIGLDQKLEQMSASKPRDTSYPKQTDDRGPPELLDEQQDQPAQGQQQLRPESSYNTNLGLLKYICHRNQGGRTAESQNNDDDDDVDESLELMEQIDRELAKKSIAEHESMDTDILTRLWLDCSRTTGHLVHELCQQLQIVLQPTKMSKYKGDYKSGKRLNMRKIISYIASHYRKDKIWLRRTRPSKRTYNICLAIDNSSSMSENNCRQMTYQSLSLLAKSLSLIEAGQLNVVSFGEQVRCIHEFGHPYVDAIGAQWLRGLRFNETRTSYSRLLKYSCEAFERQAKLTLSSAASSIGGTPTSVSQLLVIISDGRNVSSESEDVKLHLKRLKSLGVLTLFVIIDDLRRNEGKSIVDVKSCIKFGASIRVENYMDLFPFPFYILLRQLETMPSVLGDALRQWFELVSCYGPS